MGRGARARTAPAPVRATQFRVVLLAGVALLLAAGCTEKGVLAPSDNAGTGTMFGPIDPQLAAAGKPIFRYDDFGDSVFWTDTLHMNQVVEGLTPVQALSLGLKVDAAAIPPGVLSAVLANPAALSDPATTRALLSLNAVVGVQATVSGNHVTTFGITCALCHSTVDNSVAPGIGHRLDGWPNRDLQVGTILAASPAVPAGAFKDYLLSWKPGYYDARVNVDGLMTGPVLIPPAFGLHDVALETYTGDGVVSYWNDYVAVTQMHGQGNFQDARLGLHVTTRGPDLVQPKLPALREYQLSLAAAPGVGAEPAAAARGQTVFDGPGHCSSCHIPPTFTDAPRLHALSEIPTDSAWALRSATRRWRTTPLAGVSRRAPFFHDGSAPTLGAVVDRYDAFFHLGLSAQQKSDLVAYLETL